MVIEAIEQSGERHHVMNRALCSGESDSSHFQPLDMASGVGWLPIRAGVHGFSVELGGR